MIKLVDVSKKFVSGKSTTFALIDINLEIKEGEFVAIMGPSGSGKSTLLHLIGGLDKPSKGAIKVNEKDINRFDDNKLSTYRNQNVGFVFQEFYLEPSITVVKNVLLPTLFNHPSPSEDLIRVEKLLSEVDLADKFEANVRELSGGQKQRVAIARAMINNPKIIIADEPTGNLDTKTGEKILSLLKKLHKNHKTTLIIATHDESIAHAANRIIKIEDGHICT